MMKKTHVSVGVTLSSIVAILAGFKITPIFIISSILGAIFPDIDHPKSSINTRILLIKNGMFKLITYCIFAYLIMSYGAKYIDMKVIYYTAIMFVVIGMSKHRSITHSFVGFIGMVIMTKLLRAKYGVDIITPFSIGIASHIILDMFNPQGVELLWPYKKNYRFPIQVSTGSIGESIFCYMLLIVPIYLLII